jgi:hypothetical protein
MIDFGESLVYTGKDGDEGYTIDNRGTEFIKSPEMLTVAYSSNIERATYDRRRKVFHLLFLFYLRFFSFIK